MGKLLEKFGPLTAGVLMIWLCWSALSGEASAKVDKTKLPKISAASLVQRADGETLVPTSDPFQADWAPYGPEFAVRARRSEEETEEEAGGSEASPSLSTTDGVVLTEPLVSETKLWVDSVLQLPDGGQARICGKTVRVGDPVPGVDPLRPPVLLRVDGLQAEISYRGQKYVLEVDGAPQPLTRRTEE